MNASREERYRITLKSMCEEIKRLSRDLRVPIVTVVQIHIDDYDTLSVNRLIPAIKVSLQFLRQLRGLAGHSELEQKVSGMEPDEIQSWLVYMPRKARLKLLPKLGSFKNEALANKLSVFITNLNGFGTDDMRSSYPGCAGPRTLTVHRI